ncbi:hypothetical protein SDC9_75040 [bioreactor metagenome]|uniref:Flagellar assembly protein FliH/Type III secretion system HrpE domain-containing protein n=2 Tax=root TaxID=1 RepID=A0ABT1N9S4_9FIRM|nr:MULTISPECIES: FliH/SctL family protein [Lutispora]MCQ1528002.1 hypothetical protein [Lutispora saccharofermentans]MEA4960624.1 FliH/SctL family protein [Lutispora sp.]
MYRIYKSEKVSIGTPKPLVNKSDDIYINPIKENMITNDTNPSDEYDNIIRNARQMYASIIEDANNEAKKIVEQGYAEIEELKKEALEDAYGQGFDKGYKEAKEETQAVIEEAKIIRDYLDERKGYIYREAEQEVVQIILDLSRKIIGDEIQQNKDLIISQIRLALEKCTYKNKATIKVSSEDYPNVLVNKGVIESLVEGVSEVEIIEDKFLKKGDCLVDTPSGEVNSSIDLQLEQLKKAFEFALRNEW